MAYELTQKQIAFKRQQDLPVKYKEVDIDCGYRIDLLVEDALIVELKAVEKILPIHDAQTLTYMRLTGCRYGLLINFNFVLLKDGIKRFVQD